MADGMRITMGALSGGLTVDGNGKKLLHQTFVFQCPPLDAFKVIRAFSFVNYDTVSNGQFTRRAGRQLKTWQFDTLAMELATNDDGTRIVPGWVPYPRFDRPGMPVSPDWYVDQMNTIADAGAPFRFTAQFPGAHGFARSGVGIGPVIAVPAVLLGYTEAHRGGEGDAIYFEGCSFEEFRDPSATQRALNSSKTQGTWGSPADSTPTSVTLHRDGTVTDTHGVKIKAGTGGNPTLAALSVHFFHTPEFWREIADANHLSGLAANTSMLKASKYRAIPRNGTKVKIPSIFDHHLKG